MVTKVMLPNESQINGRSWKIIYFPMSLIVFINNVRVCLFNKVPKLILVYQNNRANSKNYFIS